MDMNRTGMILTITATWVAITVCGWSGQWFAGLILGVALMLFYMMLGATKKGKLSMKLMIYPFLPWAIMWIIGFYFSNHYAILFDGRMPEFTILGFHPSFAFTVFTYWVGGVLTLTVGFNLFSDHWLSKDDWNRFKEKIAEMNAKKEEI